jgi:hypothetical protein
MESWPKSWTGARHDPVRLRLPETLCLSGRRRPPQLGNPAARPPAPTPLGGGKRVRGAFGLYLGRRFPLRRLASVRRIDELLTRQYRGSEDRSVHLLVDSSVSMQLGQPVKFDVARRLAGALGYLALSGLDRVGNRRVRRPGDGRTAAGARPRAVGRSAAVPGRAAPGSAPVQLNQVIDDFTRHRPHRGLAVLISDLFDPLRVRSRRRPAAAMRVPAVSAAGGRRPEAEPDFAGSVRWSTCFAARAPASTWKRSIW